MENKVTILGIGGAGCRILQQLRSTQDNAGTSSELHFLAMDTDSASLQETGVAETDQILCGSRWRAGKGCGGDELAGQRAVATERSKIEEILQDAGLLIVVCGLGGGTATGGLPVVLGVAAKMRLSTMTVLTLPFSMEGYRRKKLADDKMLSDLLPLTDVLIALPNDLLFSTLPPEVPLAEACRLSDQEVARTVLSLSAILTSGNLFSADLPAFSNVLKRRHALCSIGVGVGSGEEATPEAVMQKMLASPLLGGPDALRQADAVAFTVLGGPELSLATAKASLELAARHLPQEEERTVLLGAGNSPAWQGMLQFTALAVRYQDKVPAVSEKPEAVSPAARRTAVRHRHTAEDLTQPTLPYLMEEDRGIMERTMAVIVKGEDLDLPAFQRRHIVLETER